MSTATAKQETKNLPQKQGPTLSDRFTGMVMREYSGALSKVEFGEYQKKLAQHLFVRVDMALKEFEAKRLRENNGDKKTPFAWDTINLSKLAVDTVHRIELGLDALVPNHIHPVPYFNSKIQKYDLDLRVGYVGKDLYHRQMALDEPVDIVYELVHENDEFVVYKKSINQGVESYEFKIPKPFDRGKVVGGFGYISYSNPAKNRLVILTMKDFEKAKAAAKSNDFWGKHPEAMQYKTIVHRTVSKIVLDPKKINASFAQVEREDLMDDEDRALIEAQQLITDNANTGEIIDIKPEKSHQEKSPEKPSEATTQPEGPGF